MIKQISYDISAHSFILDSMSKKVDVEGYIVEKANPKQKVLASNGEPIKANELGAIIKGSEIFVKSDLISLIELSDKLAED